MSVAVVADCHLGGPGGPAEPLLAQLEELPDQGCEQLVLLGDIFHVWVGSDRFETSVVRQVLTALERLRQRGVRLDYVEGNRDFFIADSRYARIFDSIALEVSFEVAGSRYLAVHGDGLNDRDRQYLLWRWLSKSAPVRYAVRWLPRAIAQRTMYSMEERIAATQLQASHPDPLASDYDLRRATIAGRLRRDAARALPSSQDLAG